jgi:hypothetical protein
MEVFWKCTVLVDENKPCNNPVQGVNQYGTN